MTELTPLEMVQDLQTLFKADLTDTQKLNCLEAVMSGYEIILKGMKSD